MSQSELCAKLLKSSGNITLVIDNLERRGLVQRHTVAAFHLAGDPARYLEQGMAWQPSRLFFTAIPRSFFHRMRDRLEAMGVHTGDFDRFEESGAGWPDDQIHVTLDVTDNIEDKSTPILQIHSR